MAKAAKKAGRATSEGLVALSESADGKTVAIASVQCETDFVSRGDDFKNFVADAAKSVVEKKPADAEALQAQLGEGLTALIAKTGENMKFGPFCIMEAADNECIGHYLHTSGKLGVLVSLACGKPETAKSEEVKTLGREIAMQVAALKPMALDRTKLDPAAIEREREVYREKARNEGKPDKIIEKIAEGAVNKFFKEVCLMDQAYIRDDKKSIAQLVKEVAKAVNDTIEVKDYKRIELVPEAK
jgi:elongation factor Ts